MKKILRLLLAVILLSITVSANAQQSGTIRGRVVDEDNLPLPGANVAIESLNIGSVSDVNGLYTMLNVPAGTYEVRISYIGFDTKKETVVVESGETVVKNFTLVAGILLEDITIGYTLQGQARAQSQQKASSNITNIVSSDQVGRFPDANIGDALKRITGINVQYDQGEARYFSLRGLESRLNSVMINGERMPSADGASRTFQLDLVPADMIQTIEVNKALTPDMDADAIGGAINLVTRSIPAGMRFSATAGSGYNALRQKPIWTGSFVFANRVLNDKLGFTVSASVHDNRFGSDNIETDWEEDDMGMVYADEFQVRTYLLQRVRQSYSVSLDLKIDANNRLKINGMYNMRNDWENRYALEYKDIEQTDDGWTAEIVRSNKMSNRSDKGGGRLEEQRSRFLSLGGDHLFAGKLNMDWSISYAKAGEEKPHEMSIAYAAEGVPVSVDISNKEKPVITPLDERFADLSAQKDEDGDYYWSLDELEGNKNFTYDKDLNARIDFLLPLVNTGDYRNTIKFGGRMRGKDKLRDDIDYEWEPQDEDAFTAMALTNLINVSKDNYLAGDYRAGSFVDASWAGGIDYSDASKFETEYLTTSYLPGNFTASEYIYAGYGMLNQNLGNKLLLIAGVRLEQTNTDYQGWEVDRESGSTRETEGTGSYLDIFPAMLLKYELNTNTLLRAAYTNTIARPNYYHLVPYRNINYENNTISMGNNELNPTRSMNLDFMIERYLPKVGFLSGGLFYKSIDEFIFTYKITDYFDPVTEHTFRRLTQPRNGHGAKLMGFEASFNHQLFYLPGFLSGLGIYLNYSYNDSEIKGLPDIEGRENETMQLPGTTKDTYNGSIFYERGGLQLRLSANYSGAFLESGGVGETPFYDEYYDKSFRVDANGSYAFTDFMRLFFEANNLTNQPLTYYLGEPGRIKQNEYYGYSLSFGLKVDF